jgi:uncharacterized protein YjbI with pentapeptide repeats
MRRRPPSDREPPSDLPLDGLVAAGPEALEPGADLEAADLADLDLGGRDATGASLDGCRLERCELDGLQLSRARVRHTLLDDVRASDLWLGDATLDEVLVTSSRIGAISASGGEWRDVRLRATRSNLVDLRGSTLVNVVLEDCVIDDLDLSGAEVRGMRLPGTTVATLTVEEARLDALDLTGARIAAVRGVGSLRGAAVTPAQLLELAPLLAAHLGIEVRAD